MVAEAAYVGSDERAWPTPMRAPERLALRAKGRDLCLHETSAQSELGAYFTPILPGFSERRQV